MRNALAVFKASIRLFFGILSLSQSLAASVSFQETEARYLRLQAQHASVMEPLGKIDAEGSLGEFGFKDPDPSIALPSYLDAPISSEEFSVSFAQGVSSSSSGVLRENLKWKIELDGTTVVAFVSSGETVIAQSYVAGNGTWASCRMVDQLGGWMGELEFTSPPAEYSNMVSKLKWNLHQKDGRSFAVSEVTFDDLGRGRSVPMDFRLADGQGRWFVEPANEFVGTWQGRESYYAQVSLGAKIQHDGPSLGILGGKGSGHFLVPTLKNGMLTFNLLKVLQMASSTSPERMSFRAHLLGALYIEFSVNKEGSLDGPLILVGPEFRQKITYRDGLPNGPAEIIRAVSSESGSLENGIRTGVWRITDQACRSGDLICSEPAMEETFVEFEAGTKSGVSVSLIEDTYSIATYLGGVIDGQSVSWNRSNASSPSGYSAFRKGIPHGKYMRTTSAGTIEGKYINGNKVGKWVELEYQRNRGVLRREGMYKNGQAVGPWKEEMLDYDGQPLEEP